MTTDFGTDLSADADLDPMGALVSGRALLLQAIKWRLSTPRGALFYDLDYGLDLREYVNEGLAPADFPTVQSEIAAEVLKDERIDTARAAVTFDYASSTMRVALRMTDATGPFALVLAVDALTVSILTGQGA